MHEMAHNFGAAHDVKTMEEGGEGSAYQENGYGLLFLRGQTSVEGYRTVLA